MAKAHLCVVLCAMTLLFAARSAQLLRNKTQYAVCSLTLQGYPNPKALSVVTANLHCNSSSPVPIGINSTYLGRLAPHFTGVQVTSDLACQQQAKGYWTVNHTRVPLFALLYFCGDYHLTLQQPSVRNVSLIYNNKAWDSAAIAFGARTKVSVRQGRFAGNSAGSTLIVFQEAMVSMSDGTVLEHNTGTYGAGVMAIDRGQLVLRDASLRYNHARWGGAVSCGHNASLTIDHTEFVNNTASTRGGAVEVDSQEPAVVTNSTFSKNYADLGGGLFGREKANLSMQHSYFTQNEAANSGGAVYFATHSKVVVQGCAYTGNHADYGGGLYCKGCFLHANSTVFINNSAASYGGGLDAINAAHVTVGNSTWHNNSAASGAALAMTNTPSPNATSNTSAALIITANTFTNNSAALRGGGLCLEDLVKVEITNSTFSYCSAEYGGGLYAKNDTVVGVHGSNLTANQAWESGGAAYLAVRSTTNAGACGFSHNNASFGGGVYCDGCKLQVSGALFDHNNAVNYGGGLNAVDQTHVSATNSAWHSNTANNGAGLAMTNMPSPDASDDLPAVLSITGSTFINNSAAGNGGGLCLEDHVQAATSGSNFSTNMAAFGGGVYANITADFTTADTSFSHNTAGSDGGALDFNNVTVAVITSCSFSGNNASTGGAINHWMNSNNLRLTHVTMENNAASGNAGGLAGVGTGKITITAVDCAGNYAGANGGAIAIMGSSATGTNSGSKSALVTVTNSSFSSNRAAGNGGGLHLEEQVQAELRGNLWHGNAASSGGAISCFGPAAAAVDHVPANTTARRLSSINPTNNSRLALNTSSLALNSMLSTEVQLNQTGQGIGVAKEGLNIAVVQISGDNFAANTASSFGGALILQQSVSATVSNCSSTGNNASSGGAMACGQYVHVMIRDGSRLAANKAATSGGAVHCESCEASVFQSVLQTNDGGNDGGAVSCRGQAKVAILDSGVVSNTAVEGAAVSMSEQADMSISNSTVSNNTAVASGGAVYADGHSRCSLHRSICNGNTAKAGGAVAATSNAQVFAGNDCSFVGNSAGWGGGFSLDMHANLTISNSTMQGNSANSSGGALYQEGTSTVLVTAGSKLLDNTAVGWGGGSGCQHKAQIVVTADSLVQGNSAATGGGFYAQDMALVAFQNSTLHSNAASSSGGGISLDGAAHANITSCPVLGNAAGTGGGGLYATSEAVVALVDSVIANNTASSHGGGIRTDGSAKLLLLGNTSATNNVVDDGWGGGVSLISAGFDLAQVMRSVHGNIAAFDSNVESALVKITINGITSVEGFVNRLGKDEGLLHVAVNLSGYYGLPCHGVFAQAILDDGTFLNMNRSDESGIAYMSFKVNRPPGLYTVSFRSPDAWELPAANLSLQIRSCVRGEVTPTPDTCQQCQPGYFSFDPQQAVCETCPANANCTGGDVIRPLPGYWRSSADSMQVHRCLNPSACLMVSETALQSCAADTACGKSNTFKDLQCSPDYTGNLCGVCAAGRGAIKLFVCRSCMATSSIIALYTIAAIVMLLIIKLLCYLTLHQTRNVHLGDSSKPPAAELIRPLVLYSQYMLIVSSMNVDWPASLSYPLKVLAWVWSPASPETLSIDCILPKSNSLPVPIQKVLFYVCMPVVLLFLLMLSELATLGVKRARRHPVVLGFRDRLLSSSLVAIFFFLPSVLRTLFSMFACTQIDQSAAPPYAPTAIGSFWVFDMNQQCFAGYHKAWALGFGVPLVLLVCLGIPTALLFLLLRNRSRLHEDLFMQQYGFLYRSYREGCCCWECVVVCQTMLLVATSVFGVNLGVFYQLIVMNGVLMLVVVLMLACRPYLYPQAGRVMLQAICCLLLTSYVALTFLPVGPVQPSPVYGLIMGSMLLVVNLAFIMSVIWQLARLVDWQGVGSILQRLLQTHGLVQRLRGRSKGLVVHRKAAPAPVSV